MSCPKYSRCESFRHSIRNHPCERVQHILVGIILALVAYFAPPADFVDFAMAPVHASRVGLSTRP